MNAGSSREKVVEEINIVLACDDSYAQHTHVVVASMLQSNPGHGFSVYVLVPETFKHAERLRELAEYANCKLSLVPIKDNLVTDLRVAGYLSVATYYRLLMGSVLPTYVRRAIYLDSDIIVQGDLLALWETDLAGKIVGVVADACSDAMAKVKAKLGLEIQANYFNAGVILVDLDLWRRDNIADRVLSFCREHVEQLTFWDQCGLNAVLAGRVRELEPVWNLQHNHLIQERDNRTMKQRLRDARIVHFTSIKPWHYRCSHPGTASYWRILEGTAWKGYVAPDRTSANFVKRTAERLVPMWLGAQMRVWFSAWPRKRTA